MYAPVASRGLICGTKQDYQIAQISAAWKCHPVMDVQQPTLTQGRKDSFFRAIGATPKALIAAFCRREKSLSCCWEKGWLVGAVGIENNADWNCKEFGEPSRNPRA